MSTTSRSRCDIGAGADGIPMSAWASAGASLTPSRHRHLLAGSLQLGDLACLVGGEDLAITSRMRARGQCARRGAVVAREHHDLDSLLMKGVYSSLRGRAGSVADADQSRARPSTATKTTVRLPRRSRHAHSPVRRGRCFLGPSASRSQPPPMAVDRGQRAVPGDVLEAAGESRATPASSARRTMASANGCSESRSTPPPTSAPLARTWPGPESW